MPAKNLKQALHDDLDALTRARDELRVQLKLASAEARDEWRSLEGSFRLLKQEAKRLRERSKPQAEKVESASRELVKELRSGYARLRTQLGKRSQSRQPRP